MASVRVVVLTEQPGDVAGADELASELVELGYEPVHLRPVAIYGHLGGCRWRATTAIEVVTGAFAVLDTSDGGGVWRQTVCALASGRGVPVIVSPADRAARRLGPRRRWP